MLALPPQAGRRGKRFLHDRRSIDEYLDLAAGLRGEPAGQDFQSRFYHVVIVRALRIDGDCAAAAPVKSRQKARAQTNANRLENSRN